MPKEDPALPDSALPSCSRTSNTIRQWRGIEPGGRAADEGARELGKFPHPAGVMSDDAEDPVDLKPEIEENCKPKCVKQLLHYEACAKRVDEDEEGVKHCTGQYFDYWSCIDKCAAPKIFNKLK